jgi:hypothetical protein
MIKTTRAKVPLLFLAAVWSCGGESSSVDGRAARSDVTAAETAVEIAPSATGEEAAADGVLGTIQAELDGKAHTWYIVEGQVRGEPYASGMFLSHGEGHTVSLGGFDTGRPPLNSFQTDIAAGNVSFGDYKGSAFNLTITIPAGQSSIRAEVSRGSANAALAYMPEASLDDVMAGTLFSQSGSIEVEAAEFRGSAGALTGTFAGELALMDGSKAVRVTNGRFQVTGLPSR